MMNEDEKGLLKNTRSPNYTPTSVLSYFLDIVIHRVSTGLNGQQLLWTRPLFSQQLRPLYSESFAAMITLPDINAFQACFCTSVFVQYYQYIAKNLVQPVAAL